jgi:hypothetical protein
MRRVMGATASAASAASPKTLYDFTAYDIDGTLRNLSEYRTSRVQLVVNVASA